jgi:hypothetical protein
MKSTGYPLHSPIFPSLPFPCVTVCHHVSTGLYDSVFGNPRTCDQDREAQVVRLSANRCRVNTILCHSSEFFSHNPLTCYSMDVYYCACVRAFRDFLMARLKEQHICVKFYFTLRKTTSETLEMISKQLLMTMPCGVHRLLFGILD